jgi:hypothetical protein
MISAGSSGNPCTPIIECSATYYFHCIVPPYNPPADRFEHPALEAVAIDAINTLRRRDFTDCSVVHRLKCFKGRRSFAVKICQPMVMVRAKNLAFQASHADRLGGLSVGRPGSLYGASFGD